MAGENVTSVADAAEDKPSGESRQRSTIGFPYGDLDSVVEMALAIHNHVGSGECEDDQLAAWTDQSPKSSGYRVQVSAARLFGVVESESGKHKLTALGRQIIDPKSARAARSQAFLNVPLFKAIYDKYKGGVIPPAAALERDMEALGVATKVKARARRVFERSAQQAGYHEQGADRLVAPGVARRDVKGDHSDEDEGRRNGGDGGGDGSGFTHDPLIMGLLAKLPPAGAEWPEKKRDRWLEAVKVNFSFVFRDDTKEDPVE